MATKDGNKRRTPGAPGQASASGRETPQRRSAATKPAPTARETKPSRAAGGSTTASASRGRASRAPATSAPPNATALPIEATAEAGLPVTQAAVTTPESFEHVTLAEETPEPSGTPEPVEAFTGTGSAEPPVGLPEALGADVGESPPDLLDETREDEEPVEASSVTTLPLSGSQPRWMRRERMPHGNALGMLIEHQFSAPGSPCRSYSDLERRSGISREALSRYVTTRPDRRRSPTIDTLVAIADAMHLSLDATCRAAAATSKGTVLATPEAQHDRDAIVSALIGGLSDDQFSAVVELLRQMRPAGAV